MRKSLIKLFLIIILGVFLVFALRWVGNTDDSQAPLNNNELPATIPEKITAAHTFAEGMHKIKGSLSLPNPCWQMTINAVIAESFPEQVTLDFTLTPPDKDIACIQVIDDRSFEATFPASEQASISARINDNAIPLDLKNLTPEEFEASN